ncbi:VOC family protein [Variovorax sp.]|uniref:VOC family protein n=1 Tax=Variovorax sp. TaxID=1871043 RepID=UPI002D79FB79|nr:VOC family protein [Variovorax sp.]
MKSISHVAYFATHVARMSEFLADFGMRPVALDDGRLYMGGTDAAPFVHVCVPSHRTGLAWIAFEVESRQDLAEAACLEGASSIEPVAGPAEGACVRLIDPDGVEVRLVHWTRPSRAGYAATPAPAPNLPWQRQRLGVPVRVGSERSEVFRLGHVLLNVRDVHASGQWYARHLGLRLSDSLHAEAAGELVGAFYRLSRGDEYVDHHSIGFVQSLSSPGTAHHASFEMASFDALGSAHQVLQRRGWTHRWGIGRHVLGSQIFDYWYDPEGNIVEHYADGDVFNEGAAAGRHLNSPDILAQWAPPLPQARDAGGQAR